MDDFQNLFASKNIQSDLYSDPSIPSKLNSIYTTENELYHFDGVTNGAPADILIDCGASANYVSLAFVNRYNLSFQKNTSSHSVRVPNGSTISVIGTICIKVQIQNYKTHLEALVLPLEEYDIILGVPWLRSENPQVNWQTSQFRIPLPNGIAITLVARKRLVQYLEDTRPYQVPIMKYRQAQHALRKKHTVAQLFILRNDSELNELSESKKSKNQEANCLQDLITEFEDVFRTELPDKPPPDRSIIHTIDTKDAKPINRNPYPLSLLQRQELLKQISDLRSKGLIQTSHSAWGAPVLFVKKKDDTWRMVVDYRGLNAVTERNTYPLPRIQDCLDRIGNAEYLTKLDLTSGYWQVSVAADDIPKTAFNTQVGKFEFTVMPFGLTNAPATFQTMMNSILQPYLNEFVIVYLDDIVIFSNSLEHHKEHVRKVLQTLRENELFAKPTKCLFAQSELEFCGHIVGGGTLKPCQSKTAVIKEWPAPTNVHEVRQFLGLAAYYRRFVKGFSLISAPIYDLIKEEDETIRQNRMRPIIWNKQSQAAFEILKEKLCTEPVLQQPDVSKPFTIETDASDFAIGISLLQLNSETNRLHPIAYDGRKLSAAERNYPVHEKELLAIKHALRVWYHYIENGHITTILTDHESLKYLQSMKRPSPRLARWIEEFGQYALNIQYRPGSKAIVPDSISRRPDFLAILPAEETPTEWPEYMLDLLSNKPTPDNPYLQETLEKEKDNFRLIDGQLYRIIDKDTDLVAPYIPFKEQSDFLNYMHNEYGHLGLPGLNGVINSRGWWPSLKSDIRKFVTFCPTCQVAQRSQMNLEREPQLHLASRTILPFDRWHIDLIGILPTTPNGNRWIITAVDYATGWPIAKPTQVADQLTIADFIHNEIFLPYGAPKELFSDMGANLLSASVELFLRKLGTRHRTTTPYHPRTNGKVERFNGLLGLILTKYLINQPTKLWDQYLGQALFACRIRCHSTSKYSPFYLLYGRHPNLPSDDNPPKPIEVPISDEQHEDRIQHLVTARTQANELIFQRAVNHARIRNELVKLTPFKPGDWVLVRHEGPQKFESRWFGPYQIIERQPLGTYRLLDPQEKPLRNLINGQRLVKANIIGGSVQDLWSSPFMQGRLRRQNMVIEPPTPEVREILDAEEPIPPRYHELATEQRKIRKKDKQKALQETPPRPSRNLGGGENQSNTEDITMNEAENSEPAIEIAEVNSEPANKTKAILTAEGIESLTNES